MVRHDVQTVPVRGVVGKPAHFKTVFMDEVPLFKDEVENIAKISRKPLT